MKKLYLFLARHKQIVKNLFLALYCALIITYGVAFWFYPQAGEFQFLYKELGGKFGQLTVVLFIIALIPGILSRLGILRVVESMLTLFRRQIGILSFFTALMHSSFSFTLQFATKGLSPLPAILKYQLAAFIAFNILMILWMTSNDLSMKFMGKWWKYLQRLSYVAAIALVFHTIKVESNWALPLMGLILLEAGSWIYAFVNKKRTK